MRAMNEEQYKLVKLFLDGFKIPPKKLARNWGVAKHEVYRVVLTMNYEVYARDQIPAEDVILAVEGV